MSLSRRLTLCVPATLLTLGLGFAADPAASLLLPTPAQDQALPYTRSARAAAQRVFAGQIAVFTGSRYAYVNGLKVRLDDTNWRDEAVADAGDTYVPLPFAAVVLHPDAAPDATPPELADRWVSTLARPATTLPPSVRQRTIGGHPYVALADLAKLAGRPVQSDRGLTLIGGTAIPAPGNLFACVVSQFDTPEKLADPDLTMQSIPTLARQGKWTAHAKATPEQLANLSGPATDWPTAAPESYDLNGFATAVLGSKVPAPGVYPRILFSPEDLPALRARITGSQVGQASLIEMEHLFATTWWEAKTSDGTIFRKLASGDLAGLSWPEPAPGKPAFDIPHNFKDQKAGIHNSHVAYVPECLTSMALYCLITGDEARGRQVAAAVANYYKLREPLIDRYLATSDSEFGSDAFNGAAGATTAWRGMHGLVGHMNLGLSLDFAGKWMTADEKETMRRVIAKATYGRRAYGQDCPVRFRDVNWVAWDLPQYLALTAIEGLPGCDPEALEENRRTVRAFCDWGIDDHGVVYESNGKTPGSFQFFTLSLVTAARRGANYFGHPHLRKLLTAQMQMTSPNGRTVVNSGTQYTPYSRQHLSNQLIAELHTFFPGDRAADYLLSQPAVELARDPSQEEGLRMWVLAGFDPAKYRTEVTKLTRLRLPSPTYPGFVRGVLFDSDWTPTTRADTALPLDFDAPVHGVFASRSSQDPDATWACMMVRPDHYLGAGHHHADAGMVHVSALGVDWLTQSRFNQSYDGNLYSLVTVDGHSEPENIPGVVNGYNGAATYLGATSAPLMASGSADLTYAYSWRWMTQPPQVWTPELITLGWEVEPAANIQRIFAGTARDKLRPWWAEYLFTNYIPTLRAPFNPMQRVFRTTAVVRGTHPYAVVVDDVKKDDQARRYEWVSPVSGGVWKAAVPGLAANQVALAYREPGPKEEPGLDRPALEPKPGDPLLLVTAVGLPTDPTAQPSAGVVITPGPADKQGRAQSYERLVIGATAAEIRFTIVLTPVRAGAPLPQVTWDGAAHTAGVAWPDQADHLVLSTTANQRSQLRVERNGTILGTSR
jgi:hypothetical protein